MIARAAHLARLGVFALWVFAFLLMAWTLCHAPTLQITWEA